MLIKLRLSVTISFISSSTRYPSFPTLALLGNEGWTALSNSVIDTSNWPIRTPRNRSRFGSDFVVSSARRPPRAIGIDIKFVFENVVVIFVGYNVLSANITSFADLWTKLREYFLFIYYYYIMSKRTVTMASGFAPGEQKSFTLSSFSPLPRFPTSHFE